MRTEITVEATLENLDEVIGFADEALEEFSCSASTQMQVELAVDELFTNISNYAYPDRVGNVTVRARQDAVESLLELTFLDDGIPFDPLEERDPNAAEMADPEKIGGLGIFLVKKMTDEVFYEHRDGMNVLTIRKKVV